MVRWCFCALNRGIVNQTVNLGERRPIQIVITDSWGFVLVYFRELIEGVLKHFLTLYTVNGDFIREIELEKGIAVWAVQRDEKGFDWIAMALENGRCYVFEAFWLRMGEPVYEARNRVLGIGFSWATQAVIVVVGNGEAVFLPWEEN
jgi:hypothetical protein